MCSIIIGYILTAIVILLAKLIVMQTLDNLLLPHELVDLILEVVLSRILQVIALLDSLLHVNNVTL